MELIIIEAIRRSGHRGTSALNWIENYILWHCSVFKEPWLYINPEFRVAEDVTGLKRLLASVFEGDDSFLSTSPKIKAGDDLHTAILAFWYRMGFKMKIEMRTTRALFVGYYIGFDERGPTFDRDTQKYMMIPEVDRAFGRSGVGCSPAIIDAYKRDDRDSCKKLSGAAAVARAYEFAGLCPTISFKYLRYADAFGWNGELTHDLRMRTHMETGTEIYQEIHFLNSLCWAEDEDEILIVTGFPASPEERNKFEDYSWHYSQLCDWKAFRESLPVSWRAA